MSYPVTDVFAWVVDDPSEQHKLIGFRKPGDRFTIQCAASERRLVDQMKPEIESMAVEIGLPIRLKRFTLAETIDSVLP